MTRGAAALLAVALVGARSSPAAADPPPGAAATSADAARDLFDLHRPPPDTAPLDCSTLGPFGCVFATDPLAPFAPAATGTSLAGAWLARLPRSDDTHDHAATLAAGVGGDRLGLYVPGASSVEDRWLVDGAPADALRGGGAGTRVPLIFLDPAAGLDVITGGFAARDRASTGAVIDAHLARGGAHRELHAFAWLSAGAPARDLPAATTAATYAPVTGAIGATRDATVAVTAGGPGPRVAGATTWYFAGAQAHLRPVTFTGTARRQVDRDGDGVPDRDRDGGLATETIAARDATTLAFDVPLVARAGAERGPHQLALTLVGTWAGDTTYDPMATLSSGGVDQRRLTGDAIATYRGRWARTRASLQWAWHRDATLERAHDAAAQAIPQIDTAFIPGAGQLPDDLALAAGCDDGAATDPYPGIADCPFRRGYFARGGAGLLTDVTADRPSVTASVARAITDEHTVEVGGTAEDLRLALRRRFTGGSYQRSLFGDDRIDTRYVQLGDGAGFTETCSDDGSVHCRTLDSATTTARWRSAAAWLEDTWRPDPRVAVDVGLRWEWQHVAGVDALHQLLPRVGAAWDPLGGGRSRVFAGFARAMPVMPGRLVEALAAGPDQLTVVSIPNGSNDFLQAAPALRVASSTSAMIVDDVTAGAEVAPAGALRVGVTGQWRTTRRGLDFDGTLIGNPQIPIVRDAGSVTVQLATAPTAHVALRLAYTYARAVSNWTGPADPSLGATYYHGVDFAGAPPLGDDPSDLRHRLVAEVVTSRRLGVYELIVGGRATAASGRAQGADDGTGAVLLARGVLGRTPPATAADIHVAVRRGDVEAGLDVVNVFDQRPVTAIDEHYTSDPARAIIGGSPADLVFARGDDGAVLTRNPRFGQPTAFLAPLTAVLYARAAF